MLSCGILSIQAQGSLKKQVEEGIQTSIRQTQNHEWHEAFATCRALDAAIGKENPELLNALCHVGIRKGVALVVAECLLVPLLADGLLECLQVMLYRYFFCHIVQLY